jgi:hypothetical protein
LYKSYTLFAEWQREHTYYVCAYSPKQVNSLGTVLHSASSYTARTRSQLPLVLLIVLITRLWKEVTAIIKACALMSVINMIVLILRQRVVTTIAAAVRAGW